MAWKLTSSVTRRGKLTPFGRVRRFRRVFVSGREYWQADGKLYRECEVTFRPDPWWHVLAYSMLVVVGFGIGYAVIRFVR